MLSDHGELPHRPWGHDPDRFDPEMVEIPFVVWLAPQFRKARPELVAHLKKRLHTPFMSDGFFHTMTDLAGISCSLMDPTRSLINPAYRERPRCVIDGRIPYIPAPEFHAVTSQGR
jgi:heptose-I-phosphate ethanolaminephosphotransferase